MNARILLIDDDDSLRRVTGHNLEQTGFTVGLAASGRQGVEMFKSEGSDLVITDVKLGDLDGLAVLAAIKEHSPETPVIVITAFGSIDLAVRAMQEGAFTFITKPFDRESLRRACRKALELRNLKNRNQELAAEVERLSGAAGMESANPAMAALLEVALRAADSEASVLITGESGTGKEVLARLLHRHSPRREGAMVAVNCAAIPPTLLESELFGHLRGAFTGAVADRQGRLQMANGGTIFLDEIGELPPEMQAKLLRVIQEREVEPVGSDRRRKIDVRIIAATNRDIQAEIKVGRFREDLFYRLGVILLHIPPLRERREDIPALVDHFLKRVAAPPEVRFSPEALTRLARHPWPGNIRELGNLVERSVILRRQAQIGPADLQLPAAPAVAGSADSGWLPELPPEGMALEEVEKELIRKALARSGGNRSQAARLLRLPRHVLIYRLEKFGIN